MLARVSVQRISQRIWQHHTVNVIGSRYNPGYLALNLGFGLAEVANLWLKCLNLFSFIMRPGSFMLMRNPSNFALYC